MTKIKIVDKAGNTRIEDVKDDVPFQLSSGDLVVLLVDAASGTFERTEENLVIVFPDGHRLTLGDFFVPAAAGEPSPAITIGEDTLRPVDFLTTTDLPGSTLGTITGDGVTLSEKALVSFESHDTTDILRTAGLASNEDHPLEFGGLAQKAMLVNQPMATTELSHGSSTDMGGTDMGGTEIILPPPAPKSLIIGSNDSDDTRHHTGIGDLDGGSKPNVIIGDTGGVAPHETHPDVNVLLMLDTSNRMFDTWHTHAHQEAAKQWFTEFLEKYNALVDQGAHVSIQLMLFNSEKSVAFPAITLRGGDDLAPLQLQQFIEQISRHDAEGYAKYCQALDMAADIFHATGDINKVYFFSNGLAADDSDFKTYMNEHRWDTLLRNPAIDVQAVGLILSTGIVNPALLNALDSHGEAIALFDIHDAHQIEKSIDEIVLSTDEPVKVGGDVIHGGSGNDIIFGDSLNTDHLKGVPGFGDVHPGEGYAVLLAKFHGDAEAVIRYLQDPTNHYENARQFDDPSRGGDDHIYGNGGDDIIFAEGGDDYIDGGAGDDIIFAGDGNDVVIFDKADVTWVDGGAGYDILRVAGSDQVIDLTSEPVNKVYHNFEEIDLGSGHNQLILTAADILKITDSHGVLTIRGDSTAQVDAGKGWEHHGSVNIDGVEFDHYTQNGATLNIESGVKVTLITNPLVVGTNESDDTQKGTGEGDLDGGSAPNVIIGDAGGAIAHETHPDVNVLLMLDSSNRVFDTWHTHAHQEAAKQWLTEFLEKYNALVDQGAHVSIQLMLFNSEKSVVFPAITLRGGDDLDPLHQFIEQISGHDAKGYAKYCQALDMAADIFHTTGDINKVYFFSNGLATDAADFKAQMNEHRWDTLLRNPNINVQAVGIELSTGIIITDLLDSIDSHGDAIELVDMNDAHQIEKSIDEIVLSSDEPVKVGGDVIHGGSGNDIIFGDSLNTDHLKGVPGFGDVHPGEGYAVLLAKFHGDAEAVIRYLQDPTNHYENARQFDDPSRGGDDHIYGNGGDDIIFAEGGNDYIDGGAGNDIIFAGDGDDIVIFDPSDITLVDGGAGHDVLRFTGDNQVLDLTSEAHHNVYQNFEEIDLGSGHNRLILNAEDVLKITDGHGVLTIRGDDTAEVDAGRGWVHQGSVEIDGVKFEHYTQNGAVLNIESAVNVSMTPFTLVVGSNHSDDTHQGTGHGDLVGGAGPNVIIGDVGGAYVEPTHPTTEVKLATVGGDVIHGGPETDIIFGDAPNTDHLKDIQGFEDAHPGEGYSVLAAMFHNDTEMLIKYLQDPTNNYEHARQFDDPSRGGADHIYGHEGNDIIFGEGGDDYIDGGAGNDIIFAGDGNDIVVFDPTDTTLVDGGAGYDILQFTGLNQLLDLTSDKLDHVYQNFEEVDLGTGNNRLTLNVNDVLEMTDQSHTLNITGEAGSEVVIGTGWTEAAPVIIGGETFSTFTQGGATLHIEETVAHSAM